MRQSVALRQLDIPSLSLGEGKVFSPQNYTRKHGCFIVILFLGGTVCLRINGRRGG